MRSLTTLLAAASVASLGVCIATPASAQVTARVVASCGASTYVAGTNNYQTVDTTGRSCGAATTTTSGLHEATASVPINVATAVTTQLVAISGSKLVYVSQVNLIAAGTTNVTFEYGTGSLCGTGTTVLSGAYNLTAQVGLSAGNGAAAFWIVPAGNALCMVNSAAIQVSGSVSYAQP